jgi:UDP-2-acetamido-3-amino-2,3-dideoxy-glucuronate N-acetyltransferase
MSHFQHETAIVDAGAQIGDETKIWHWTHISGNNVRIGRGCSFGQNCYVGNNVAIGDNCKVQNNVSIYDRVILQDNVFCGPSMVFTNVSNPRSHVSRKDEYKTTLVKQGASLGANCTVICGNEIGEFAFVAAGAVITRNVPAYGLMAGVPAHRIGWMCACGGRLSEQQDVASCDLCSKRYRINDNRCLPADAIPL